MLNKYAERTQPCRTSFLTRNHFHSVHATLILASCFLYSLASKLIKCRRYPVSIIITQSLSWEIESNAFLKFTKHIAGARLCALCNASTTILRFVIWSIVTNSLTESRLFVYFCFGIYSDPLKYDPKKDRACMWDKSNCSVICTLFKITFLGKLDERGNCPFHWPLTSFPDRHTYSVHSIQYCLSFCFEQFCWDLIRTCSFATCCLMARDVLWTKRWRLDLARIYSCSTPYSFPFFIMVQAFTMPFPPVCDLCGFIQFFRCSLWRQALN